MIGFGRSLHGRVHESERRLDRFTCPTNGFGLYLFIETAAQTTRDVINTRDMCVADFRRRRRYRQLESLRLSSFQDFGLAEPITRALIEENYQVPTPIQAQTVPLALTGRDIVGIA